MANLDLQALEDRAKRVLWSQGQGGANFTQSFVDCANDVIGRINRKADLATRISRIDAPSDTVSLDEAYRQVGAKIDEIAYDLRNSATDDDTNDETAQTAQLGPLG